MIINEKANDIVTNLEDAERFSINADALMFAILSKKLYSNPIQSVIRELVSNAIDANIAAGVEIPIQVHFPNTLDNIFYVRDSGIGMDENELRNVFTYGGSNKRDSNAQIGGLGVGAKSPFSITESFTVESAKNGVKRTALCFMGPDGCPRFKMIGEENTSESGTKIYFSVAEGYANFIRESVPVFLFSVQMPEILNGVETFCNVADVKNIEEFRKLRKLVEKDSHFCRTHTVEPDKTEYLITRLLNITSQFFSGNIVVMGGVPYDVDISQVWSENYKVSQMFNFDNYSKVAIFHFPIGSLAFQASREKLNYTEDTKKQLQKRYVNFFVRHAKENLKSIA